MLRGSPRTGWEPAPVVRVAQAIALSFRRCRPLVFPRVLHVPVWLPAPSPGGNAMKFVAVVLVAGLVGTFATGQGAVLDDGYVMLRDEVVVAYHSVSSLASQVGTQVSTLLKL